MAYKVVSLFFGRGETRAWIEEVDRVMKNYEYNRSEYDEYHDFFETNTEALAFKKEVLRENKK